MTGTEHPTPAATERPASAPLCRRLRETECTGFSDSLYVANQPGYETFVCPAPCRIGGPE